MRDPRDVASSRTSARRPLGCALKSKSASSRTAGKWAILNALDAPFVLARHPRSTRNASASRSVSFFSTRPRRAGCPLVPDGGQFMPRQPAEERLMVHDSISASRRRRPHTRQRAQRSGFGRSVSACEAGRGPRLMPTRCARSTIRVCRPVCSIAQRRRPARDQRAPDRRDHHPYALADQPPRHRIGVGVDHRAARSLGPIRIRSPQRPKSAASAHGRKHGSLRARSGPA